jgi:hypothetical protein
MRKNTLNWPRTISEIKDDLIKALAERPENFDGSKNETAPPKRKLKKNVVPPRPLL